MKYLKNSLILVAVGERIREIRKSKQLTQNDIAKKARIATSQVGRIERGELNASISTLFVICRAMKIELKELFEFEESFLTIAKKDKPLVIKGKAKATVMN